MLSVPTVFTVLAVNSLALGMVWTYVMTSYPNLNAARFWAAASLAAALGTGLSASRVTGIDPAVPVLLANVLLLLSSSLTAIGMNRFFGRPLRWRLHLAIIGAATVGLAVFLYWRDDMAMRMVIFSLAQSIAVAMTVPLLFSRRDGGGNAGAYLAGGIAIAAVAVHAARSAFALLSIGGAMSFGDLNAIQGAMVLVLVFVAMSWNFGFLLMAIDRLRGEVAELALVDDLTGVANRRHLVQRLAEECALARRTEKPFALLAIDLDGFKEVNDSHGHAAGDHCLRHFTELVQSRLRSGDLLARSGGDEFNVILPATTLGEAAALAGRILEACRADAAACQPGEIAIATSIGVAQWQPWTGQYPERLIAAADQALYAAKNEGKNRFAVCSLDAPSLAPDLDVALERARSGV